MSDLAIGCQTCAFWRARNAVAIGAQPLHVRACTQPKSPLFNVATFPAEVCGKWELDAVGCSPSEDVAL